jgi:glycosyltransferase involved in cell wall biosynthesis
MPLRVALVHSFYSSHQPSGENLQVQAEAEALGRAGVDVTLLAYRTDELEGDPLYRMRCAGRVATGWGASPRRALTALRPDVVHVHNLFPNLGRRWLSRLNVPVVLTLHNYRFVCANGVLFRDGRQCTDCPDGDRRAALRHRCYRGSLAATLPLAVSHRGGPAADPALAVADRVLCLSGRQRRLLLGAGIDPGKVVDWANFLPRLLDPAEGGAAGGSADSSSDRTGCVYVGRLSPEKGALDLVRSWPDHMRLTVVGDGPLLADVQRAARRRPVTVLGSVERRVVLDLMARSAVLVVPGATPEVAPLSYIEALASGLPMVVRRGSELADRVERHGVGHVVDDLDQIPTAATRLATEDIRRARCRAVYEATYTEHVWRTRVLDLYADVIGERAR